MFEPIPCILVVAVSALIMTGFNLGAVESKRTDQTKFKIFRELVLFYAVAIGALALLFGANLFDPGAIQRTLVALAIIPYGVVAVICQVRWVTIWPNRIENSTNHTLVPK